MVNFKITLTDFIQSVLSVGANKIVHTNQIINRGPYKPEKDFYLIARNFITRQTRNGDLDLGRDEIKELIRGVNPKKKKHFESLLVGYNRFLKTSKCTRLFIPTKKLWGYDDLIISVNPEVGVEIDGKITVIKLHLKCQNLEKNSSELSLTLMREVYPKDYEVAILDVRKGRLIKYNPRFSHINMMALLRLEANTFIDLWKQLSNSSAA
ncbi:hypothetical protein [Marinoscillum pacificum]|uniref:hypothetical protein n=1 Tax=Marinoscillum pacificum TaxID=392723 RepID=UPI00215835CB|nr:hypothetical protein [Marinoscillum pacificum]